MKKLKKLTAIGMAMAMTMSFFTGCSTEGTTLANAFSKKVTSEEFKTEIGLRLTAENLSAQEKVDSAKVIPMINNSKFTMNGKINQSSDGKAGKLQADVAVQAGNMPINMSVWADTDLKDGTPKVKEIIKVPSMLEQQMNGKQYLVLDTESMQKDSSTSVDFDKLSKVSEDMQQKLSTVVAKNILNIDPGFKLVTDKGTKSMVLPDGEKDVHVYEVRLNDTNFKKLVKSASTSFVNNKETREFLKDYLITVMQASNLKSEDAKTSQAGIEKAFADFEKGLPEFNTKMNNVLDSFDSVPLVGSNGIVIDYAIDSNGDIVNEQGSINLVFDSAKFIPVVERLSGTSNTTSQNKLTGVYNLGIDFNASSFNINKNVEITLPEVNDQNSIKFEDLMKEPQAKKTAIVNTLAAR